MDKNEVGEVPADSPVTKTATYIPLNLLVSASLEDVAPSMIEQVSGVVNVLDLICSVQEYHW